MSLPRRFRLDSRSVYQVFDANRHVLHDPQQRGDELLVDINLALVLGEISLAVCVVKDPYMPTTVLCRHCDPSR